MVARRVAPVLAMLTGGLILTVACTAAGSDTTAVDQRSHGPTASHTQRAAGQFAGHTVTAQVTGYLPDRNAIRFQPVKFVAGGADNGRFEVAAHAYELPLDDHVTVRSAITICSDDVITVDAQGHAARSCTADELVDALRHGKTFIAKLTVNDRNAVTRVMERYRP